MGQYYYTRPGRIFGPISNDDLRRLVASGVIRADDLIAKDGTSKFRVAVEIEGLEFTVPPSPVSPPPLQNAPAVPPPAPPPAPVPDAEIFGGEMDPEYAELAPIEFAAPMVARSAAHDGWSRRRRIGFVVAILLGAPSGWLVTRLPPIQDWMARQRVDIQRAQVKQELERLHREAAEMREQTGREVRVIVSDETRQILGEEAEAHGAERR
jgi:hypothetical protein